MTEMNNTIVGSGADLSGVDFEDLVAEMIRRCGDSPEREGMMKTPERVAKAMAFLTKGYTESPEAVVGDAIFCQRDVCQQILDSGGDYFIAVKKNQERLFRDIRSEFAAKDAAFSPLQTAPTPTRT